MSTSASTDQADLPAVRDGPGAGCLTGVLEGLMVTVQHKNYGSEQLVHPLQAEEEAKGRHAVSMRAINDRSFVVSLSFIMMYEVSNAGWQV